MFVALDLPPDLRRRLASVRERVDPAAVRARWVNEKSLHLTLQFLGEVSPDLVSPLESALHQVKSEPLHVQLRGFGFFPRPRAARILWAGVECAGIGQLRNDVRTATGALGFPFDSRGFHAHVTLARGRGGRTMDRSLAGSLEPMRQDVVGDFDASAFFLYRSHLQAGGAVYEKQAEFQLARG